VYTYFDIIKSKLGGYYFKKNIYYRYDAVWPACGSGQRCGVSP
jgi:hypothetical protein